MTGAFLRGEVKVYPVAVLQTIEKQRHQDMNSRSIEAHDSTKVTGRRDGTAMMDQ